MAPPVRRNHRLEHLRLGEEIDVAVNELGEQLLWSKARVDRIVRRGGAAPDVGDAKLPDGVKPEIPRRRHCGGDQRHQVWRELCAHR